MLVPSKVTAGNTPRPSGRGSRQEEIASAPEKARIIIISYGSIALMVINVTKERIVTRKEADLFPKF